ncbi:MAG: tetratricopeptide repeat protein [Cyclobacteriaceae bacterium]
MATNILNLLLISITVFQSPYENKRSQLEEANDSLRVHLLSDLCYEYRLISQDSAISFGEQAIELATNIGYQKGLAQAYNDLGIIYADRTDLKTANKLYRASLKIRENANDSMGVAAIHSKLGILYQKVGLLDSALTNQFKCLRIYEKKKSNFGISYTLNNIAIIFFNKGDHESSLKYHNKALSIRKTMGDKKGIAISLGNIANILFEQNKFREAIAYSNRSLVLLEKLEAWDHMGSICNNISNAYLKLDVLDSSKLYIEKSISIRKRINDVKGLISNYHNLGKITFQEGNPPQALDHFLDAFALAEEHQVGSSLLEINNSLMDVYQALGKTSDALHHALSYIDLKDSIDNQNAQKTLLELQTKYETEKKEQQIALQQSEIAEQKAQNQRNLAIIGGLGIAIIFLIAISLLIRSRAKKKQEVILKEAELKLRETQIEAALNSQELERRRFSRDLHDGFGQMISVLNLNLKSLEKGTSSKEEVFENSSKVLDEMYKELKGICFNLMPETLIKSGIIDAIKEFASRINHAGKLFIEVDTFGITKRLEDLQEISIYRITQEWINNILKYSDANKVTISLTKDEEEITLLIEDNGSGFDKNDLIYGKGNGWKNMNSRANLIKGELELDTNLGIKGSTLIINAQATLTSTKHSQEFAEV